MRGLLVTAGWEFWLPNAVSTDTIVEMAVLPLGNAKHPDSPLDLLGQQKPYLAFASKGEAGTTVLPALSGWNEVVIA